MARECKLRENASIEGQEQKKEWKKMKYQRFLNHKGRFYWYCHYCHKFGHKVVGCRIKRKYLSKESKKQTRSVRKVPHGKMWRRKEDSKGEEEIKISKIKEVSQDDVKHNSTVDKNNINYNGKHDENTEEEVSDGGGAEVECLF